ncbi:APC family permease [Candidatus Babeliales bacterium]|nr:APC family permease [Candidatus Babeliales bacterium]
MKESKISLFTATLININIMVGAGIYIAPSLMAQKAGSFSFLGWGLSALVLLPIVLNVVKISQLFPGEGSFFNYSKEGLGKTAGFLSGWIYFLGYVSIQAMQMLAMREILTYQLNMQWIRSNLIGFNALFFVFICLFSLFSLSTIGKIQNALTFLKLLPIVFIAIAMFIFPSGPSTPVAQSSIWNLNYTLPLALFGFWGFEGSTSISHRIKGSSKNAARSINIAFITTVFIFTIFHFGVLKLMGVNNLSKFGAAAFAESLPMPGLATLLNAAIPLIIVGAIINSIYAEMTSFSFLLHAMAKERLLFCSSILSKVNRNNQPLMTIFFQGFLAFLFVTVINNVNALLAIGNLGLLGAFLLTLISLISIQKRKNNTFGMLMTSIGFISCAILGYYSYFEIGKLQNALYFIAVTILGLLMYMYQTRKNVNEK